MRSWNAQCGAAVLTHGAVLLTLARFQSHATTPPTPAGKPSSGTAAPPTRKPRGVRLDREAGLSSALRGIDHYAGSISAFMQSPEEKKAAAARGRGVGGMQTEMGGAAGPRPCDIVGSSAALQAAQAEDMAAMAKSGKLLPPRRAQDAGFTATSPGAVHAHDSGCTDPSHNHAKPRSPQQQANMATRAPSSLPRRTPPATLNEPKPIPQRRPPAALQGTATASVTNTDKNADRSTAASTDPSQQLRRAKEAQDYYQSLPKNELSKEEMWRRINAAKADREEADGDTAIGSLEVDYLKMEEELRAYDLLHYRLGEIAYPDLTVRRDYYAMWNLAMSLNKARWAMLEVHSQRGMKTTGAGMKLIFWKESVASVMETRGLRAGQFTDSHPVLRPFGAAVERNPHITKAFVRGFTDARLKVLQQPGNVQQLFDHFDKFYGYFFNSLLEVTNVKDEAAEHIMTHIGRATGLTTHCVMFWKKYARLGFTMLPADICADNHVNLALLKNIPLASRDQAVRKVLYDVMCIAKSEMLHAQTLAKDVPPKAWPIVMECLYANYYLGFLQRRHFNVSAMFADHNIENAGFTWYRLKKRWEWERYQSLERLMAEEAPIPYIGTTWGHRSSKYKKASGVGQDPAELSKRNLLR